MRRLRWRIAALSAVTLIATFMTAPVAATPDLVPGLPVHLALGDSWAWGQGPDDPATEGYVPQLADELRVELDCLPAKSPKAKDGCKHLQLLNLARPAIDELGLPGVTAPLVIDEQFPIALPLLVARNHDDNPRNNVEVVTLHVGGNDVTGPITEACIFGTPEVCGAVFDAEMTAFFFDLHMLMAPLREAAGPEARIVLGTYDNPVPYCFLGGFEGAEELGDLVLTTLHGIIASVAATYGAEVADVFDTFAPEDFVGGLDCLHPTATGHDKVTDAFLALLGD